MARPLRGVSPRVLFVIAGAAALAAPPLLLRAEPQNWPLVQETVKNMSPSERDRLDRNTREFLALSEPERQKYRDLHAALQVDIKEHNEKLATTMQEYYAWLATNQAYDRETIISITDPTRRVAEIQKIVDKRSDAANRARYRWSSGFLRDVPELTPEQLKLVMSVLEGRLQLNDKELERLHDEQGQEKAGVARYFALFVILRGQHQNLKQVLDRFGNEELDDLVAAANIKMPQKFAEASPEERRVMVFRMIFGNVRREYERAVNKKRPSSAELEQVVAEWPQEEQQQLLDWLEMEPSDFRRKLEETYAKDKIALDVRDLWDMAPDIFGRGRGGPDDGQRGGDRRFGPSGDRPGPERRDGHPPFGPGDGERPPPGDSGGPRHSDRRPGDRPPPRPAPGEQRPRDDRPPPRP